MTGNSDILRLLLQHRLDDEDGQEVESDDDGENQTDINNASLLEGRADSLIVVGWYFICPTRLFQFLT
jgi:hypothetical protein